ncbi:MAG: TetR/AcrR family transcriptional regulator [Pseudomonadales bacterium]|nr:TetR/AcrR family transcriptional regulator [Pseudomonadales bacterium]
MAAIDQQPIQTFADRQTADSAITLPEALLAESSQQPSWPQDISISAFRKAWILQGEPLWLRVFETHREKMQIKNASAALANLEKIFNCTFQLANSKGFQAMSLRDLSRETGISMGGLYAYIGSKDDLAAVIEGVLRQTIDDVMADLEAQQLDPVARVKAIIHADMYMNDTMHNWYYFCYLEAKGLSREQRDAAIGLESKFHSRLVATFEDGIAAGIFHCKDVDLLAIQVVALLQQWYLKRWKFQQLQINIETYISYLVETTLKGLAYRA